MSPKAATNAEPRFSVVVPLYNERPRLPGLLRALQAQTFRDFEVVFVDNDSTDESHAWLLAHAGPGIVVIRETTLQNADAARNAGIRVAKGAAFAFTDADCLPDPEWLARADAALTQTGADLVAGRIAFDLGPTPGPGELYDSVTFLQHSSSVAERGLAFTANLIVTRRVMEKLKGFDVATAWNGDVLFTRKAVNLGFALVYADQVVIRHPARGFVDVLKKSWRIAQGKGRFRDQSGAPGARPLGGAAAFVEPKPHFRHLNPRLLKRAVLRSGHNPPYSIFLRSWLVAWAVAATGVVGFGAGWLVGRSRQRWTLIHKY